MQHNKKLSHPPTLW